jgi:hypothetical protein
MANQNSESVPKQMQPICDEITRRTDAVCRDHLDDEYAQLCRRLAAALARKRPSPLARGKPEIWACAIVYALGTVNFLFDKTQTPYLRADELCSLFGVSQSSAANKARQIRDMFEMVQADPRWYRPSQMNDNPLAWMVMVNGLIVDIRMMPREVQEEACRKGLIPYLPGQPE